MSATTASGVTVDKWPALDQQARLCRGRCGGRPAVHPCRGLPRGRDHPPDALRSARARRATDHIPWVTYTDPELAQVGLTEAEARKRHGDEAVRRAADFAHNDRAIATGQAAGFAKVMVVKGRPVGATIVGPQAGELIQLWALAIANGLKMSAVAGMVAPYPTLGEINKRVAQVPISRPSCSTARW
jgi:hypothetical protein